MFANLVAYSAAGFTCALARGLAFAAATSFKGLLELLGADCFNMFRHWSYPFRQLIDFTYLL